MDAEKTLKTEGSDELQKKQRRLLLAALAVFIIGSGISGLIYFQAASKKIYIEKAEITAPKINLTATTPGTLEEAFVKEGDKIEANSPVARVSNELVKAKVSGIIIAIQNDIGKNFNPNETVASMISPKELQVIGQIEENKGLKDIKIGQQAAFTVDAFSAKTYYGTVDEISPTSREGDIVFNISDKRQVKEFNIKIRFNIDQYPELKNGMSAKIWIYK